MRCLSIQFGCLNNEFNISLTEEQCNYLLKLLEERPFKEVLQTYGTIELQMTQQRLEATNVREVTGEVIPAGS